MGVCVNVLVCAGCEPGGGDCARRDPQRYRWLSLPAGINAKLIKPVNKTKKLIVLGQTDTLGFNNVRTKTE